MSVGHPASLMSQNYPDEGNHLDVSCSVRVKRSLELEELVAPPTPKAYCNVCDSYFCCHSPALVLKDNKWFLSFTSDQIVANMKPCVNVSVSARIQISVFSHNVSSLDASQREAYCMLIAEQSLETHLVFLQETRSQHGVKQLESHVCVCSGHHNHSLGMEIWLPRSPLVCVHNKKRICASIDMSSLCIIHCDPRFLLVSI